MKKVRLAYGAAAIAAAAPALALTANAAQAANAAPASTRLVSCSAAPHHWTVLKGGEGSLYCFGYNGGTWKDPATLPVGKECGGNNFGWWADSRFGKTHFSQGTTYRSAPGVYSVHISGWGGTDICSGI
jgi:hypothetical protein